MLERLQWVSFEARYKDRASTFDLFITKEFMAMSEIVRQIGNDTVDTGDVLAVETWI